MILIDLQKAFDTIDHEILFQKMDVIGFSQEVIDWFQSYLLSRSFKIQVNKTFSKKGDTNCGVPQGSILGPLLFLIYVNDMSQAVECDLFLYADDSCLLFQNKNIENIQKILTENFSNLCDWFVDNKLSIHFDEDKTKSILFSSKHKIKKAEPLKIRYKDIEIAQHKKVTYLGCILDETLNGESMALNVLKKGNSKLKCMYRKSSFLTKNLKRLLCNALIQPHLDYACASWFPNLNKKLKTKLQSFQNKCIRFCLELKNRNHIGHAELKEINWLNISDRVDLCNTTSVHKFINNKGPPYMADIFSLAPKQRISTRHSLLKLKTPFRSTNMGQNCISFIGPSLWNNLDNNLKEIPNLNSFKHKFKSKLLKNS